MHVILIFLFSESVVTIGFTGNYTVREDTGTMSVVVHVLINSLDREVDVILSTQDGTARSKFAQC